MEYTKHNFYIKSGIFLLFFMFFYKNGCLQEKYTVILYLLQGKDQRLYAKYFQFSPQSREILKKNHFYLKNFTNIVYYAIF